MNVLLLAPTAREARAVGGTARVCGAASRAQETVARLLDDVRPVVIVLAGVCGGLDPSLTPGDLIVARRVVAMGRPELVPELPLLDTVRGELRRSGRPFVTAPLLSVERPLGSCAEKTQARNATGAAGVDMETYAIAAAAHERSIAWVAIRAVLDPARLALPPSLHAWSGSEAESRLIVATAVRPWEWPQYARLALAWRAAVRSLRQVVPEVAAVVSRSSVSGAAVDRSTALAR